MPLIIPVASLVEATIMYVVFVNICKISYKKIEAVLTILGMALGIFIIFMAIPITQLAQIFSNVLYISILLCMAYMKLKKLALCVFFAVFSNIIALLSASITSAFLIPIMDWYNDQFSTELILVDWKFYIPYVLVFLLIAFIFSFAIGRMFNKKIEMLDDYQRKSMGSFLAIGSLITLLPFWTFSFFWEYIFTYPTAHSIVAPIFIFFFILFGIALISFTNKVQQDADLRVKEEALKHMQEYTRKIESMASEARNFRHDHYNLLLGFTEYILDKDFEGLRVFHEKYLEAFRGETNPMHSRRLDTLVNVTTPALKSLYIAKIMYAQQLKIDVRIDIPHEIGDIHEDVLLDFCRIVGIFLDNAIEACMDVPESKIELGIVTAPEGTMFIFENTCINSPADISKIFERGYSTKGNDRGTGLSTVSRILKNNKTITLITKFDNGNFVHLLTLHKK